MLLAGLRRGLGLRRIRHTVELKDTRSQSPLTSTSVDGPFASWPRELTDTRIVLCVRK